MITVVQRAQKQTSTLGQRLVANIRSAPLSTVQLVLWIRCTPGLEQIRVGTSWHDVRRRAYKVTALQIELISLLIRYIYFTNSNLRTFQAAAQGDHYKAFLSFHSAGSAHINNLYPCQSLSPCLGSFEQQPTSIPPVTHQRSQFL